MSRNTSIINVAKMKQACLIQNGEDVTKIRVGKGFPEAFAAFVESVLQDCMRVVIEDGRLTLRPEDLPRLDVPTEPDINELTSGEYAEGYNPDPGGNGGEARAE